jgi:hypothetical protein
MNILKIVSFFISVEIHVDLFRSLERFSSEAVEQTGDVLLDWNPGAGVAEHALRHQQDPACAARCGGCWTRLADQTNRDLISSLHLHTINNVRERKSREGHRRNKGRYG